MTLQPSFEEFSALSREHNLVPLRLTLPLDTETPVSLYQKLVGQAPGFMLESASPGKNFGRYSFLGRKPFAILTGYREKSKLQSADGCRTLCGAPLDALKEFLAAHKLAAAPDLPLFSGGAVGYLAYEAAATWERIRNLKPEANEILSEMLFCRELAVFDHLEHAVTFIYLAAASDKQSDYENGVKALGEMAAALDNPMPEQEFDAPAEASASSYDFSASYCKKVQRAQEYIASGDAFQIVLSHEQRRQLTCSPFALYRRLRRVNPSPYMFYLNFGAKQILGASPERLVKLEDGIVSTHPIAGTRPRGADKDADARLAAELKTDAKELAEHAMLVDLGRNDIGKISQPGSVELTRLMEVENFSHVMHLVSEVIGKIRPDCDAIDALKACFPAGTVSGAPKARVMEIIRELEDGAIGYLDFRGNMDTCIAIRTLAVEKDEIIIRAGAGVVADSLPENEYNEVRHKSEAMFKALEVKGA